MEEVIVALDKLGVDERSDHTRIADHGQRQEAGGRRKRFRGRRVRGIKRNGGDGVSDEIGDGDPIRGVLSLSLSLRVEKNVICLLLGRRVIKTLVRRTAGKHGANLVDLVYKLARITLGKREAKKLVKRTLNIIAEVSVLTIHRKLSPHLLELIRTSMLAPLKTFQEMHQPLTEPSASSNESMSREDQERRFTDSVRLAEKELFILLQPLVQERTLHRFVKVARILRDPAIVRASFLQEDTSGVLHGVRELVQEVLDTVGEMAEEQKDRELERVSKSKSKPRRSRTRTKSKKQTSRSKKATSAK